MPLEIVVKSTDPAIKAQRGAAARRVLGEFGSHIPDLRLLSFFDDEDWLPFKQLFGAENRGFYMPLTPTSKPFWPPYLRSLIFEPVTPSLQLVYDHAIYLYGSSCSNAIGLTMTFAHELQHFVQHSNSLPLWSANTVIPTFCKNTNNAAGLRWCDIPHEREARMVSKRTAEEIFGIVAVTKFIDTRIAAAETKEDASDWKCIGDLSASDFYDLERETKLFFPKLRNFRSQIQHALKQLQSEGPDFESVDLDALFSGPRNGSDL